MKLDKNLSGVQRASNALLLSRALMPAARIAELEEVIKTFYEVDVVSQEILEMGSNLEIRIPNVDYTPHGLKVVRYFQENRNLHTLERRWREHFLTVMNPQHLPALWSVEHNREPEEKWSNSQNDHYQMDPNVSAIKEKITIS